MRAIHTILSAGAVAAFVATLCSIVEILPQVSA